MPRYAIRASVALLIAAAFVSALVAFLLLDSLPRRDGRAIVATLAAPVRIELDAHAVPRIIGARLEDVYGALGFVHAQQRFFQMDLTRRNAAGELAALFGRRALALDEAQRRLAFRSRARALLDALDPHERASLEAYSAGVNAGLEDLGTRPPEYLVLGEAPVPWTPEDSLLVVYSMYTMLSNNDRYEAEQGVMRATLPRLVYELLTPSASRFDRPIMALEASEPTGAYRAAPIPPADVVDVRGRAAPSHDVVRQPFASAASNHWALPAARTASGHALLANDPHLGLRVPTTFFRAELYWDRGLARGLSLPGVPGILIGATERIAWGATVSNADQSDYVVIEMHDEDPDLYLTPNGYERLERTEASIDVAGEREPVRTEITTTRWGPIVEHDWLGRPLALRATWLEPDGLNLGLLDVVRAETADAAIEQLARWSGPSLNWLVADADGDVAWVVNGPLPARRSFDGAAPESWADGTRGWDGRLTPPRLAAASERALYTANNRLLDYDRSLQFGRLWWPPFRADRIATLLAEERKLDEHDSLAIQLDTRAHAYDLLRTLVLGAVASDEPDARLRDARRLIADWNGHADLDEPAFRLLDRYYDALLEAVLGPLLAPARAADPRFVYRWPLADESLRRILDERPAHLLAEPYDGDWNALVREALVAVVEADAAAAIDAPWREINSLDISHPLASIPLLGAWLRFDALPLPGSPVSVRVATPTYGAVFRLNVAPSAPEDGILELAGGQSGHFLSRHFDDQLDDWASGAPTPFLAGPTVDAFTLTPE